MCLLDSKRVKEFPTLAFDPIFELLPELSSEVLDLLKQKLKELTTDFIAVSFCH